MSPMPIVFISIAVFLNIGSVKSCDNNNPCREDECCVDGAAATIGCQAIPKLNDLCSPDTIEIWGGSVYDVMCPCADGLSCIDEICQ